MYLSILDADGDMLVGMSDMRIVQQDMPEDYLPSKKALIQGADVVTCDPCMGEKTLLQLLDLCTPGQIICVDPVSCGMRVSLRRLSAASTPPSPTAWSLEFWPEWKFSPTAIWNARARPF